MGNSIPTKTFKFTSFLFLHVWLGKPVCFIRKIPHFWGGSIPCHLAWSVDDWRLLQAFHFSTPGDYVGSRADRQLGILDRYDDFKTSGCESPYTPCKMKKCRPQKNGDLKSKGNHIFSSHWFSGDMLGFRGDYFWCTPWKINMEPTNHPFRKENDLPNLHDYVPC